MRLALKLSLLLAGASVCPLLLATAFTLPRSTEQLRRQLDASYRAAAEALAEELSSRLQDQSAALALYPKMLRFDEYRSQATLGQALKLIYGQTRQAGIVALIDEEGRPVVLSEVPKHPREQGFPDQEWIDDEGISLVGRHLPYEEALQVDRAVIGPPYLRPDETGAQIPRVVVAVPTAAPRGKRWVLAAEISLRPAVERLSRFRLGETGRATLFDALGRTLWSGRSDAAGERVGAAAQVRGLGWEVRVDQSSDEALKPVRRQLWATFAAVAVGLLAAFGLGFTAVRAVTVPVGRLERAAAEVQAGNLEHAVVVDRKDELGRLSAAFNTMVQGLRERERLRASFSRYLSGEVAARILRESSDLELKGEQVEVTIMFLDIRGFTALAEKLSPREVVELLNTYFERVVSVLIKHEGVVMKYIGDAVMAMFGVPRQLPDPEARAVAAALEIQALLAALNADRARAGQVVAQFGIGINTGVAVAGNIGSSQRLEYTVVGDAVNLAERLQGQAGPGEVLVSGSTYQRVRGRFRFEPRGEVRVKGKERSVEVWRVVGFEKGLRASG